SMKDAEANPSAASSKTSRKRRRSPTFEIVNGKKEWYIDKITAVTMKKEKGVAKCFVDVDWKAGDSTVEPIANIL
ncbi:hypothetical protein PFISCL1PPCAC_27180, partial [Pristionchus fissidentatus]